MISRHASRVENLSRVLWGAGAALVWRRRRFFSNGTGFGAGHQGVSRGCLPLVRTARVGACGSSKWENGLCRDNLKIRIM
jgi:hypothetical protein